MMNLDAIRYLLLDFDGPICSVFAGFPAGQVAEQLRACLRDQTPPSWMAGSVDPHEILRASAEFGPEVAEYAHRKLSALEIQAVKSAVPTPYAEDVILGARTVGAKVAVVSNNAETAVIAYLSATGLARDIDYVSARTSADPWMMKPNPYLVAQAIQILKADRNSAVLVGDQVSDVIAAHRTGIRAIGYANKDGKVEKFKAASADLIITSMSDLLALTGTLRRSVRDPYGLGFEVGFGVVS
jgi:phosphoglycolate phosphatase-like HAD superfamily hydrolase